MIRLALVALATVAAFAARWLFAMRFERSSLARLPRGADGVIVGAAPIARRGGGSRALLLLHGFGDTPQTFVYMADHLHRLGFDIHAPLLPGHGRTLREFARATGTTWINAVELDYRSLRDRYESVGIVGVSMGGALAVILCSRVAQPDALVLVAPYLSMRAAARHVAAYHWLVGRLIPYIATREEASIRDEAERASNRGFGTTTPRLLRELRSVVDQARSMLPGVRAPTLMIQSRGDNRIDASDAEAAFAALGASDKRLVWVDEGGHVITVDKGRERVLAAGGDWLVERMGRTPPSTPSER